MKKRFILLSISIVCTTLSFAQRPGNMADIDKAGIKLTQLLYYIDNLYVDSVNLETMTDKAMASILQELDPHSSYIPKSEVESANEGIQGNFEGIGIRMMFLNDTVVVDQTITGCPAEKVGILPGDRLVAADGKTLVKIKRGEVPKLLRGPKGSTVEVTVVRRGEREPMVFKVVRDKIPLHSVDAAFFVEKGIGYIKLNSFSQTTTKEVAEKIEKLKKAGELENLILDLQSNGGGVMSAATNLVDLFLPGNKLIVYTQGEHQQRMNLKTTANTPLQDVGLAVLMDEYSASASEITAGALQDWDRAVIVGRRSFGKGLVQRPLQMRDGSEIRLTIARYYTPSGRNIQKPYAEGKEKYYQDLENRYKHGEFVHPDSIQFPDSLKYYTLNQHRTVYGGGGIFPDVFVPLDTARYSPYYRRLVGKGVFNSTVSGYLDENRNALLTKYRDFEAFDKHYAAEQSLIDTMIENGKRENVEYDEEGYRQSEKVLRLQIKAVVAQSLYGAERYFQVMQTENDALHEAIKVLKKR